MIIAFNQKYFYTNYVIYFTFYVFFTKLCSINMTNLFLHQNIINDKIFLRAICTLNNEAKLLFLDTDDGLGVREPSRSRTFWCLGNLGLPVKLLVVGVVCTISLKFCVFFLLSLKSSVAGFWTSWIWAFVDCCCCCCGILVIDPCCSPDFFIIGTYRFTQ